MLGPTHECPELLNEHEMCHNACWNPSINGIKVIKSIEGKQHPKYFYLSKKRKLDQVAVQSVYNKALRWLVNNGEEEEGPCEEEKVLEPNDDEEEGSCGGRCFIDLLQRSRDHWFLQ